MSFKRINVADAGVLIAKQNAVVIDIRDGGAYAGGHIDNAQHIHNDNAAQFVESGDFAKPLIVCCYHGNMSQGAADYFNEQGFTEVYSLDGGYAAWQHNSNQ